MSKILAGSGKGLLHSGNGRGAVFTHRGRHRGRLSGSLTLGVLLTDVSEIICPAETHVPTPGEDFCSKINGGLQIRGQKSVRFENFMPQALSNGFSISFEKKNCFKY